MKTKNKMKRWLLLLTAVLSTLVCSGCGTTRAQRLLLYGTVLDAAGHPELGAPVRAFGLMLAAPGAAGGRGAGTSGK